MILRWCCAESEIKEGSLIGLFFEVFTERGRYFQALVSFSHSYSTAKFAFCKNYGLDCWLNPCKTFSAWSYIERLRSLRGILAWNWRSWAHTLWSIRSCVFVSRYLSFSQCISDFWLYVLYWSSIAGHSHSKLKSGKSFLNSWKLGHSESQPTRLHITLASNLDRMKRIEKDFEMIKQNKKFVLVSL